MYRPDVTAALEAVDEVKAGIVKLRDDPATSAIAFDLAGFIEALLKALELSEEREKRTRTLLSWAVLKLRNMRECAAGPILTGVFRRLAIERALLRELEDLAGCPVAPCGECGATANTVTGDPCGICEGFGYVRLEVAAEPS